MFFFLNRSNTLDVIDTMENIEVIAVCSVMFPIKFLLFNFNPQIEGKVKELSAVISELEKKKSAVSFYDH